MQNRLMVAAAFVIGLAVATPVSAGPIVSIVSGDGETWTGAAPIGGGAGNAVIVDPHPAWQQPGAGQWISYADTGYAGGQLAPPSGTARIATIYETFTAGAGSILNLKIWADDTAGVSINGMQIIAPNFTQGTCANGSIGCEPHEFGSIVNYIFQSGGTHTIAFDLFQVGTGMTTSDNPLGLLYEGTLEQSTVPEPASLALLGIGLVGVARRLRTRRA